MMMTLLLCLIQAPSVPSAPTTTKTLTPSALVDSEPLDFVEAMEQGWTYAAELESAGGVERLLVTVTNPGRARTLQLDAGLVFQGPDEFQPPVVMEDLLVDVPRGEHQIVVMHPGCGNAILASAEHGMAFNDGVSHISEELGRVMDRMNDSGGALDEGLQDMVWVYTNAHGFSSVYVDDSVAGELNAILDEEVDGYEAPGYAVKYREPEEEDQGRFTGEAMEIRCELNMVLQQGEPCRVVMVQPDGERIEMMEGFALRSGPHDVTLTMAFEGYPPGAYQLRVEGMRSGMAHFEREVTLQGRG